MYHSLIFSASLLSFIPQVLAAGSAHVVNNCGFDVYYASVAQSAHASLQKLPSGGYSEAYSKPNNGISIKLAINPSGPVTQFEFTWGSPNIYYDISNIDGNPFAQFGTSLTPSAAGASGYPTCRTLSCPAGQAVCQDAYNLPDDVKTHVCPDTSDLTFTLCPGGAGSNSSPAQSSPSTSVPAISVPAPSPVFPTTSLTISEPNRPTGSLSTNPAPPATTSTFSFRPTSFQTSTTRAGRPSNPTSASTPNAPSNTPVVVPIASSAFQNPPVNIPSTTAAAVQSPAPTGSRSWSWGNWKHYHTHRAHVTGFRS